MPNKLFVFHFRPLENYPPTQNFIQCVQKEEELSVRCFTTYGQFKSIQFGEGVKVYRLGKFNGGKIRLWLCYLWYNLYSILVLIIKRPKQLIYYESLSAFPAYIYKTFVNSKANLYIHYHEYTSPSEYKLTSPVERWFHKLEKKIYKKAIWISHTNAKRLDLFLNDENIIRNQHLLQILPNYPSQKWAKPNKKWRKGEKLKIIYVGYALDEHSTYIREFIEWLRLLKQEIELDLYCIKMNSFPEELIENVGNLKVSLKAAIPYSELPTVLSQHHVGVILYKGLVDNYIYNAPNKLFEYLSCGLDVWYPNVMKGIYDYDSTLSPKVIRLNFNHLSGLNLEELIESGEQNKPTVFSSEEVYTSLIDHMKKAM